MEFFLKNHSQEALKVLRNRVKIVEEDCSDRAEYSPQRILSMWFNGTYCFRTHIYANGFELTPQDPTMAHAIALRERLMQFDLLIYLLQTKEVQLISGRAHLIWVWKEQSLAEALEKSNVTL